MSVVKYETDGPIATVTINRPEVRNAVDRETAAALAESFRRFDADDRAVGRDSDRQQRLISARAPT